MTQQTPQEVLPQNLSAPSKDKRWLHRFQIPDSLKKFGISSLGLVELTAGEELMATKRSGNNPMQLAYELTKESLREVDGRKVSTADGTADVIFNSMHPQVRTLLSQAYALLHAPKDEDTATFLSSRESQVG